MIKTVLRYNFNTRKLATRGCILEHINRHTLETVPRRLIVVIGQWQSESRILS